MDSQSQANLNRFFPGLGTPLPPASPAPATSPGAPSAASTQTVHDFATSNVMVLDENRSVDCLKVNDIAKYPSPKPNRASGTTFVTSRDLIAYAVKGGSVRVIHKDSAARTLLKGHTQPIVDMTFSPGCLATCADDDLCIVWEIMVTPSESGPQLEPRETLRLRVPSGDGVQRVKFHPLNELLMFVVHGPSVSGIRLNKSVWEAYSSLENPEDGVPLEQVASYRLIGGHTQTVNDIGFSVEGKFLVTASDDGYFAVWALNDQRDADIVPVTKVNLGRPIVFTSFVGSSIVCGFAHNEELVLLSGLPPHNVVSRVRFASAKAGTAIRLRAQTILRNKYALLCDSHQPIMILVLMDATGINRAVSLKVPSAVHSFSVREVGENSVEINAVGENMIQTFELPSISDVLPPRPIPSYHQIKPMPVAQPVAAQAPPQHQNSTANSIGMAMPPGKQMMYPPPSQAQPLQSIPPPQLQQMPMYHQQQPSQAAPGLGLADMDRLVQEKMDQLFSRLDSAQKARDTADRERQMRLLEVISTTIATTVPETVEKVIATKLTSPEFAEMLTSVVKTGVEAALSKGTIDKALKSTLPSAMEKMTDTLQAQLASKLQQPISRAFEDAFRARLVPAFEAGCRNMMTQFEESFTKKALGVGGAAGMELSVNSTTQALERIRSAINQQNYPQALWVALETGDSSVLTETCEQVDLAGILVNLHHGIPQTLLLALLSGLSTNVTSAPLKRLEWIESVALALDPNSPDISGNLPAVAKQAKDALVAENQLYASLGPQAARFRAVTHILVSLGGR